MNEEMNEMSRDMLMQTKNEYFSKLTDSRLKKSAKNKNPDEP